MTRAVSPGRCFLPVARFCQPRIPGNKLVTYRTPQIYMSVLLDFYRYCETVATTHGIPDI